MKKSILYIAGSFLIFFSACSDWLDVQPKTSIKEKDLFNEEYGFKDVLTGFYLKLGSSSLYGKQFTYDFMELLAKRYDQKMGIDAQLYNFTGDYKAIVENYYKTMYKVIANINNFIYYTDANRNVLKTPDYYEIMKGEALGLRAFLHFDLLRLFGPLYAEHPETKCLSYRRELNAIPSPLLPAYQIVDSVLADLHAAEALLKDHDPKIFVSDNLNKERNPFLVYRQTRMNIYAVYAMLARVYLYKGDAASKAKAYEYALDVINSGYFELAKSNSANRILFQEHIFCLYIHELDKIVDSDFKNISSSNMADLPATINTVFELDQGGGTDFRMNVYAFELLDNVMVLRKYDQTGYRDPAVVGGRNAMPLIRLPEMYYILAECAETASESADWLNLVRQARGIAGSDDLIGDAAFDQLDKRPQHSDIHTRRMNEIMKEYSKEFYGEGQLFYLYKRLVYRHFYKCPFSEGMKDENFTPKIPDDEYFFGNNN